MRVTTMLPLILCVLWLRSACQAAEGGLDEFKVKRQEVFEFAEAPKLTRQGDRVEIAFTSKGYCDVTIAIEDAAGRIVRHLASGVLGPKAPEPFQKDALAQTLIWDGKDDEGRYLDDKDNLTVRVSLGLKPQFERTHFWHPAKRTGRINPSLCAAPEGMYVYDGEGVHHLRLFDHAGNYLRTVYPCPADKLDKMKGMATHTFVQDGKALPLKSGYHQASVLTSGEPDQATGYHEVPAANALAVRAGKIALINQRMNRLASDGSTGGLNLDGGKTAIPNFYNMVVEGYKTVSPRMAAFSPDGKWVYQTCYNYYVYSKGGPQWHHVVMRSDYASGTDAQIFAGNHAREGFGTGENQFRVPTSVACDKEGRVYVSDYANDRVQVFNPDGKLLKSIPVQKPAQVCVHQVNGEIYVFSWFLGCAFYESDAVRHVPSMTRLGAFDDPKVLSRCTMPDLAYGRSVNTFNPRGTFYVQVELDSWANPPAFWLIPGVSEMLHANDSGQLTGQGVDRWDSCGIKVLVEKEGKLAAQRDFGAEVAGALLRGKPAFFWRQRLHVNPKTGKLYVSEADSGAGKAVTRLVEVEPETGKLKLVELPLSAEDLCFDRNGLAYLRLDADVPRYDFETMREVPWDYGEEREKLGFSYDCKSAPITSSLPLPGHRTPACWHMGGMDISVTGNLVVPTCDQNHPPASRVAEQATLHAQGKQVKMKRFMPPVFPGRLAWGAVMLYDKHGKAVKDDLFPGIGMLHGIGIDRDDNTYVLAAAHRIMNGKNYDPALSDDVTGTLIKVRPKKAKAISSATRTDLVPVPLPEDLKPKRSLDLNGLGIPSAWVEDAEWMYSGLGFCGGLGGVCSCWNMRFSLDYFARSFVPESRHFSVAVLDTGGNLILRIGRCGNVQDGKPLVSEGGPPETRAIGGDEVALFHACYLATHTDRRLFIADSGNARILSVKLGYHAEQKVALKGIPDGGSPKK